MKELDINEIAKTMTREEFLNCIDDEGTLIYDYKNIECCPSYIKGLKDCAETNSVICDKRQCYFCWKESVKDIKFKDDLEQTQQSKNTNIKEEPKLYYGDEILKMIREGKIKEGQNFYIYYNGQKLNNNIVDVITFDGSNLVYNLLPTLVTLDIQDILKYQFQFAKKEYITFDEARKLGIPKHREYGYDYLNDTFSIERFIKEMDEKLWEVEE